MAHGKTAGHDRAMRLCRGEHSNKGAGGAVSEDYGNKAAGPSSIARFKRGGMVKTQSADSSKIEGAPTKPRMDRAPRRARSDLPAAATVVPAAGLAGSGPDMDAPQRRPKSPTSMGFVKPIKKFATGGSVAAAMGNGYEKEKKGSTVNITINASPDQAKGSGLVQPPIGAPGAPPPMMPQPGPPPPYMNPNVPAALPPGGPLPGMPNAGPPPMPTRPGPGMPMAIPPMPGSPMGAPAGAAPNLMPPMRKAGGRIPAAAMPKQKKAKPLKREQGGETPTGAAPQQQMATIGPPIGGVISRPTTPLPRARASSSAAIRP